MAVNRLQALQRGALDGQQAVVHPLEMLTNDVEVGIRQQMVDIRDPAGDGILDRHHRQFGCTLLHRLEHILEAGAWQRFHI